MVACIIYLEPHIKLFILWKSLITSSFSSSLHSWLYWWLSSVINEHQKNYTFLKFECEIKLKRLKKCNVIWMWTASHISIMVDLSLGLPLQQTIHELDGCQWEKRAQSFYFHHIKTWTFPGRLTNICHTVLLKHVPRRLTWILLKNVI